MDVSVACSRHIYGEFILTDEPQYFDGELILTDEPLVKAKKMPERHAHLFRLSSLFKPNIAVVLQPHGWCCVECVNDLEPDVCEE